MMVTNVVHQFVWLKITAHIPVVLHLCDELLDVLQRALFTRRVEGDVQVVLIG